LNCPVLFSCLRNTVTCTQYLLFKNFQFYSCLCLCAYKSWYHAQNYFTPKFLHTHHSHSDSH
jgi:hypothetical protein